MILNPDSYHPATLDDVREISIKGIGPEYGEDAKITLLVEHRNKFNGSTILLERSFIHPENKLTDIFQQWVEKVGLVYHNSSPEVWHLLIVKRGKKKEKTLMLSWLDGKKTYITAILAGVAMALYKAGFITEEVFEWFMTLDLPAMMVFLRQGVKKS